MHIVVDVSAGDPKDSLYTKTTHCIIVFVAVDDRGKPIEVKRWKPEAEEDVALEQYAKRLMEVRKGIEEEMSLHRTV